MQIRNVMEMVVKSCLEQVLQAKESYDLQGGCDCQRCQMDAMALALNNLPPRYVVGDQGEVYVRTSSLNQQFNVDILFTVLNAVRSVQNNPRH